MRKRRKRNGYSDALYFRKYVKNRALKIQPIHLRGIGKYMQKVATVYTIQKYRGKGCENTGMEMFSAGKLYDTNDNMLLTMKRSEIMYQKWIINKIVAYIEHMWLDGCVEHAMVPQKMKSLYIFFEGHQAYGVLSSFRTTDLASCNTSKLTLSSNVRMRIMILRRRKHVHQFVWYLKPEHYLTSEAMEYDWATFVKVLGCRKYERVGYLGPLAKFIDKDNENYQWAELNVMVKYYYYMTFAGWMFST